MQPTPVTLRCPVCSEGREDGFVLTLPEVLPGFDLKGPTILVAVWKHRRCGRLVYAPGGQKPPPTLRGRA